MTRRTPGHVVGDGKHSIAELVEIVNQDPRRGVGHEKVLTRLELDAQAEMMMARVEVNANTVPAQGDIVHLRSTANLSTGGTATDVTDIIHPDNRDAPGLLNATRDAISKLPLETAERMVPMLHACNIATRHHQVDNIAVAQASLEKARVISSKAVIESPMGLSGKHKDAAEGYVPPSRVGKKAIAGYFDEVVSAELKTLAAVQQRTVQSLLEEALSDLFIKHEPVMGVVRNALKRQP